MERGDLLNTYAEYLITPPLPESPEKAGAVGGTSAAEIEFGKQELEFCKQEKQEVEDRDEKRKIWRGRDNGILLPLRIFSRSMKFRLNYSQNVWFQCSMNVVKICWRNFLNSVWISTQKYTIICCVNLSWRLSNIAINLGPLLNVLDTLFGSRFKNVFYIT